jgi:flagellar biosynthesis anti-sigma factor FlgM
MRIDLNHGPQSLSESNPSSSSNSAAGNSSVRTGGDLLGEDQTQLSGAHTQVAALAAQASQLPEVRQEKVQALRLAIQGGLYSTVPEQVAGAMLAHMMVSPAK